MSMSGIATHFLGIFAVCSEYAIHCRGQESNVFYLQLLS